MSTRTVVAAFATLAALAAVLTVSYGARPKPAAPGLAAGDLRKSGTIRFPVSCRPEVKEDFETAVALLHSFFYEEARNRFHEIARRDPDCAMAWWGVGMTWYHPIWAPPTPEELQKGAEAVRMAKKIGGRTDLERGFIEAIDAYFRSQDTNEPSGPVAQSCHGPRAHGARELAFREALERLRRKHPEELEVNVFYSLSLLATAPETDKTYLNQLQATATLEPLFEKHPNHPGIAHYIIHAYDYPTLAPRGLKAARRYSDIAPWVPHALHMPSHIYTRLGMWKDSIEANLASSAAARDWAARAHRGASVDDDLHALDYLVFAYLQTGRERKAREIVHHVGQIRRFYPEKDFATAYAVGAIPARWTLERKRWSEAAALPVWHSGILRQFPFAEAHIQFARAVGGARGGNLEGARAAIARLAECRDALQDPKYQWWIDQVEIQRLAAAGWLARAEGKTAEGEKLLRAAADLEHRAGTRQVTPGQILPAREQLGDLLMELGRPAEALGEYEKSLEAFPNRFNGHFGAARAAELAGKGAVARKHYERAIELAGAGDGWRKELAIARAFRRRH
jgi:hypothetical protein